MPSTFRRSSLFLACALLLGAGAVSAEALVKPVPQPALGRLPAEQARELTEARKAFDEARVNLVGDALAQAYAQLGVIYGRAGLHEEAAVALADAAALAPNDGRWPYLQGVLEHLRKNEPAERAAFERAYALDKTYVPIRVALATALLEQGAADRAGQLVEEYLAAHQDQPKLYALKGDLALRQRRYAEAATALQQALKLDPGADKLYGPLAEALQGQGDAAGAAAARAKAGATPPRLIDPLGMSLAVAPAAPAKADSDTPMQQAAFFLAARQYPTARAQLDLALKANPQDSAALALYARVEAAAGDTVAAQHRAEQALQLAPNDALALLTQGVVRESAGDEAAAQSWYAKAIAANAELTEPHQLLGNAAMRAGQYARAAEQYRALVRLEPLRGDAYAQLAAALSADGKCQQAAKELGDSLREHPRLALLVQVQARVVASCRASTAQDRAAARERAKQLYRQLPTPGNTEALALAAAANGEWDDATQLQGAAIFDAVKGCDAAEIALYKVFFQQFQAKQLPERPWPPQHPYFHPARLAPVPPDAEPKPAQP